MSMANGGVTNGTWANLGGNSHFRWPTDRAGVLKSCPIQTRIPW